MPGNRNGKELRVRRAWCKGCGICVAFCPTSVLELDPEDKVVVARPEACTACGLCELRCPDLAIELAPVGAAREAS